MLLLCNGGECLQHGTNPDLCLTRLSLLFYGGFCIHFFHRLNSTEIVLHEGNSRAFKAAREYW